MDGGLQPWLTITVTGLSSTGSMPKWPRLSFGRPEELESLRIFIIHHDVIDTVFDLAFDFWHFCRLRGFVFTEEAPLAYAMHMLCGNPYLHTLRRTADLWASDWTGCFADVLPDGKPWTFVDY